MRTSVPHWCHGQPKCIYNVYHRTKNHWKKSSRPTTWNSPTVIMATGFAIRIIQTWCPINIGPNENVCFIASIKVYEWVPRNKRLGKPSFLSHHNALLSISLNAWFSNIPTTTTTTTWRMIVPLRTIRRSIHPLWWSLMPLWGWVGTPLRWPCKILTWWSCALTWMYRNYIVPPIMRVVFITYPPINCYSYILTPVGYCHNIIAMERSGNHMIMMIQCHSHSPIVIIIVLR